MCISKVRAPRQRLPGRREIDINRPVYPFCQGGLPLKIHTHMWMEQHLWFGSPGWFRWKGLALVSIPKRSLGRQRCCPSLRCKHASLEVIQHAVNMQQEQGSDLDNQDLLPWRLGMGINHMDSHGSFERTMVYRSNETGRPHFVDGELPSRPTEMKRARHFESTGTGLALLNLFGSYGFDLRFRTEQAC